MSALSPIGPISGAEHVVRPAPFTPPTAIVLPLTFGCEGRRFVTVFGPMNRRQSIVWAGLQRASASMVVASAEGIGRGGKDAKSEHGRDTVCVAPSVQWLQ